MKYALLLLLVLLTACGNERLDEVRQEAETAATNAANSAADAAMAAAQERADQAMVELQARTDALQQCLVDAAKQQNQSKALADSLGDELGRAKSELEACEDKVDAVIADAARRLCCVQRVENPDIDSFSIENSRIVCETDGDEAVTC